VQDSRQWFRSATRRSTTLATGVGLTNQVSGLVMDRREGRWVYYSLVPEALSELGELCAAIGVQARRACP
jgi:hypothetical protein